MPFHGLFNLHGFIKLVQLDQTEFFYCPVLEDMNIIIFTDVSSRWYFKRC